MIWISYKCTIWSIFGPRLCLKFANTLLPVFVENLKIDAIYAFYPESFCDENLAIRKVFFFSDSGRNNIDINIDIILISIISILIYIMLSNMWRVCFRIFEVNIGKRGLTEND